MARTTTPCVSSSSLRRCSAAAPLKLVSGGDYRITARALRRCSAAAPLKQNLAQRGAHRAAPSPPLFCGGPIEAPRASMGLTTATATLRRCSAAAPLKHQQLPRTDSTRAPLRRCSAAAPLKPSSSPWVIPRGCSSSPPLFCGGPIEASSPRPLRRPPRRRSPPLFCGGPIEATPSRGSTTLRPKLSAAVLRRPH